MKEMSEGEAEVSTPMDQEGAAADQSEVVATDAAEGVLQLFSGIQQSFKAEQDTREVCVVP